MLPHTESPQERRITLRLLAYWEKRRSGRPMPTEADIDPADIADLWPYCFMAQTRDIGKPDHCFTYLGSAIQALFIEDLTDHNGHRHIICPDMEKLAAGYRQVLASCQPLVTEGTLTNPHGDVFKYRQALLPLGTGNEINALFGGMRFLQVP